MNGFDEIIERGLNEIKQATDQNKLNELKAKYVGKQSELAQAMKKIAQLPMEKKADFGKNVNIAKQKILSFIASRQEEISNAIIDSKIANEKIDITLPGRKTEKGSKHPWEIIKDDLMEFFSSLGYTIAEGNEVELDRFNFELLNIPKDHPARAMQDSFYIDDVTLLRSHTSAVQSHVMLNAKGQGPIKVICPGKVYRRDDDDMTHSHQFGQCEGLVIGEKVNLGALMETLTLMIRHIFGAKREVRFRPSFFPFTEPSIEVDVSCFECGGKGCDLCKGTGWIEILGAGMVHPNVLRDNGFDPDKYQGFAFGVGIERLAMLKYGIDDIRKFYNNDVSFLHQFKGEK